MTVYWAGAGLVSSRCQCFQLAQGADAHKSLILVRNYSLHDQICSKDGTHSSVLRMKGFNSLLKAFQNLFIVSQGKFKKLIML